MFEFSLKYIFFFRLISYTYSLMDVSLIDIYIYIYTYIYPLTILL